MLRVFVTMKFSVRRYWASCAIAFGIFPGANVHGMKAGVFLWRRLAAFAGKNPILEILLRPSKVFWSSLWVAIVIRAKNVHAW